MDQFSISSSASDQQFTFSERDGEFFTFEVISSNIRAKRKVTTYTDEHGIAKLFLSANETGKPWKGCKEWKSLEGEFSIQLTCNSIGHVNIQVNLIQWRGGSEDWHVIVNLTSELGKLQQIENNARAFFCA